MGKVRLTDAQKRWLADPRPYFRRHTDRTGIALINKGVIVVTEYEYSSDKCGYELTEIGRAALPKDSPHGR